MTEREAQIRFERQVAQIIPDYTDNRKINSDTIFFYINQALDEYVKSLYRQFQINQEISDKLRKLVKTEYYTEADFTKQNNKFVTDYPEDYMFALGEQTYIRLCNDQCPNLVVKARDVIEATIESVDRRLEDSLSEYHLRYNQAKPIRVYTDNKIVLYTDGQYTISNYNLTYLKKPKKLGDALLNEYEDLPDYALTEVVDVAVETYLRQVTATSSSNKGE